MPLSAYRKAALDSLNGNWKRAAGMTVFFLAGIGLLTIGIQHRKWFFLVYCAFLFLTVLEGLWKSLALIRQKEGISGSDAHSLTSPGDSRLYSKARRVWAILVVGILLAVAKLIAELPGTVLLSLYTGKTVAFVNWGLPENRYTQLYYLHYLLCSIPGQLVVLRLSMALFLLKDHPHASGWTTLVTSWRMMKGRTLRLFLLLLTFYGWLLACIPTLLVGLLWLIPYVGTAMAAFYQDTIRVSAQQYSLLTDPTQPALPPSV